TQHYADMEAIIASYHSTLFEAEFDYQLAQAKQLHASLSRS
ncbi:unnamed protein product, partial [marine sediment metagenome]